MTSRILLNEKKIEIILRRLCYQLKEKHGDFSKTILVGLQPRGTLLLERLVKLLNEQGLMNLKFGKLDTTFFRDDYRRNEKPLGLDIMQFVNFFTLTRWFQVCFFRLDIKIPPKTMYTALKSKKRLT